VRGRILPALALALALCGCDVRSWYESLLPKEEIAYAKGIIAKLRARDYAAVEAPFDPTYRDAQFREKLEQIAAFFPEPEPTDIGVVGSHVFTNANTSVTTYDLTFQYEYPKQWVLVNVVLERRSDALIVKGLHAQPLSDSLQHVNRFTLQDKGASRYLALAYAILVPIFIVVTLVACIRTKVPRRKWLWLIFILLGFGKFTMNWTTGETGVQLVSVQLLGAGVFWSGPYGPMLLSASIPVGAALFWLRRKRWREMAAEAAAKVFG